MDNFVLFPVEYRQKWYAFTVISFISQSAIREISKLGRKVAPKGYEYSEFGLN